MSKQQKPIAEIYLTNQQILRYITGIKYLFQKINASRLNDIIDLERKFTYDEMYKLKNNLYEFDMLVSVQMDENKMYSIQGLGFLRDITFNNKDLKDIHRFDVYKFLKDNEKILLSQMDDKIIHVSDDNRKYCDYVFLLQIFL